MVPEAGTRGSRRVFPLAFHWVALDRHVLLVDVRTESDYRGTFIGPAKGEDYGEEALEVAVNGSPVWDLFSEVYFEPFNRPHRNLLGKERYNPGISTLTWEEYIKRLPPGVIEITSELDKHVLFVATERPGRTWGAYVGAVEGKDEFAEAPGVVATGSEIPFELAWVVFRDLGKGTESGHNKWHRDINNQPDLGQRRQ